ncbi:hypothetical protein LLS1_04840 [Leifsonia sp. LS1]|nr:hypothetical protein LLS1_04840 [Leifsonia sp. LS1]
MVVRSVVACGIDIETRRDRLRAFARASVWSGVPVREIEQWTQAEALWKAGTSLGRPAADSIPIPERWVTGWQLSRDHSAWIFTVSAPQTVWSVALMRGLERARGRFTVERSVARGKPSLSDAAEELRGGGAAHPSVDALWSGRGG